MLSHTRGRLGAVAMAATVIAAGLLAAAPANAAGPEITVANSVFTEGDWGTGLEITGAGFTPDAPAAIVVAYTSGETVATDTFTASADGTFTRTITPDVALVLPEDGEDLIVSAGESEDLIADSVVLTVLRTAGIQLAASTISTADLADRNVGLGIVASGYVPGEAVAVSANVGGEDVPFTESCKADRSGTVSGTIRMTGVKAGTMVITLTGAGGHVETASVTVTGDTTGGGIETPPVVEISVPPTDAPAVNPGKLPVVSG